MGKFDRVPRGFLSISLMADIKGPNEIENVIDKKGINKSLIDCMVFLGISFGSIPFLIDHWIKSVCSVL